MIGIESLLLSDFRLVDVSEEEPSKVSDDIAGCELLNLNESTAKCQPELLSL